MISKNLDIKKEVSLSSLTTFGIGGPADFFCETKTKEELVKAIKWAYDNRLPYFILGGGSNVLIADKGIRGLVIKIRNSKFEIPALPAGRRNSRIVVESGLPLVTLINLAQDNDLSGLESLVGIPGTVGGAIFGNAGGKNGTISQVVQEVTVIGVNNQIYKLTNKECKFDYRFSRFQKTGEIIISVDLKLKKAAKTIIKKNMEQFLRKRENQPKGKSAGSIFKNPPLASAGYLIENAGLKGTRIGDAIISLKHANWIINLGSAKADDVLKLILLIKEKVKQDFKVELIEEIKLMGDFNG